MEEAGCMIYTAAMTQVAIEMFWLHFGKLTCRPSLNTVYRPYLVIYTKHDIQKQPPIIAPDSSVSY